jgi:hypothetical protein
VLPLLEVQTNSSRQASKSNREQTFKLGYIVPSLVGEPFLWWFLNTFAIEDSASTQEEIVLCSVNFAFRKLHLNEHLEGKEQLVALEK